MNGNQTGARKSAARHRRAGLGATRAAEASRGRLPFPRIISRTALPFPRIVRAVHFRSPVNSGAVLRLFYFRDPEISGARERGGEMFVKNKS